MSAVATWSADIAAPEIETKPRLGFFQRLIKTREKEALRRIHTFLASQSDQRLVDLGYSAEDIEAVRQGRMPQR